VSAAPQIVPSTRADLAGYVEAVTADRVLGWAWSPGTPAVRAAVELRLGDAVVARAVADRPRPDLASSGVGDGCHAFELAIPEAHRGRSAELRVFAATGDGEPVPIGAPPAPEALSDQLGRVLRGVDALVGSQRLLHRNLQAALTSRAERPDDGEAVAAALARLESAQAAAAEQIAAVERFVVRLDERLAAIPRDGVPEGRAMPLAARWALAVSGTALVVSVAGLAWSLGL
jgi:hypothetical protein